MVKLYNRSNVIGAFSALNSISIGYENNNARTIQFTDNGNTISFQLFNLQEIIGSTTSVTYTPIDTTSTGPNYNDRVFEVFDFLSSEVFQGFSPGPTYVGGVVAAYPNFASFPVTGTQSVIYIDEADNSAYYWDGTSYQLLVSTGVEQYATFALFPVTGSANVIYIDMSTFEPYVWDGAAYVSLTDTATVAWGSITGTLAAQTDLQAALDAKFDDPTGTTSQYIRGDGSLATFPALTGYVPYTGATTNVDLGEFELKAGQLELDQTPTGTAGVAVMRWNDTDGTADLGLKGGNVTLQVGQEMLIRAVNKSGGDLLEANYQAVRLRLVSEGGAAGQRLAVKLALADSDINSATTIGLVTETINNNQEGFITTIGNVREINTTGSLQGETWVDGDILYLSPTVAGQLTNIKPVAPDHLVVVGYVEYAHAIHGKIYVKCDNGYELDELHNVYINAPTTWQVLRYDATAGYWTNSSLTASIIPSGIDAAKIGAGTVDNTEFGYLDGVTSSIQTQIDGKVPTTRTLTINGTTQDLSADRTFTIATGLTVGTTPITSGTVGRVLFEGTGNVLQESANFFWDNTNSRLGIGTATPSAIIHSVGSVTAATAIARGNYLQPTLIASANSDVLVGLEINPTFTNGAFTGVKNNWINLVGNASVNFTNQLYLKRGDIDVLFASSVETQLKTVSSSSPLKFFVGSTSQHAQFFATTGNLLLQNGGTFTDAGYKLDVNGTARVTGVLTAQDNIRLWNSSAGTAVKTISAYWTSGIPYGLRIMDLESSVSNVGNGYGIRLGNGFSVNHTSNQYDQVQINNNFNPISGNGSLSLLVVNPTINQTGGANGITRCLHINPTVTAAADFRAIEVSSGITILGASTTAKASLRIPSGTAPTSPVNGDIWFDGTNIKMQIGGVTKTFTLI